MSTIALAIKGLMLAKVCLNNAESWNKSEISAIEWRVDCRIGRGNWHCSADRSQWVNVSKRARREEAVSNSVLWAIKYSLVLALKLSRKYPKEWTFGNRILEDIFAGDDPFGDLEATDSSNPHIDHK